MERTFYHLDLFSGAGGLSAGLNDARDRFAGLSGRFECLAAVDFHPATVAAFNRYTATGAGRVMDLFSREQFIAYHGHEPPPDWREVTPADIRALCRGRVPDLVSSSPPCRGFSGLLPEERSKSRRYQALNALAYRGIWLVLEAFESDPPPAWLLENVPRIQSRGKHYLEQLEALFAAYGYSMTGTEHCCGEIGGLAQKRRRYLLVARHRAKLPALLYQPPRRRLLTVGDVLGELPLPGAGGAGPIHDPRRMAFKTAVRLALIPPGRDWRALRDLRVIDGVLADFAVVPEGTSWQKAVLGVRGWEETTGTVTAEASATTGAFSVADPRPATYHHHGVLGVQPWEEPGPTVTAAAGVGRGRFAVADPRPSYGHDYAMLSVRHWRGVAGAVTTARAGNGQFIADPRPTWNDRAHRNKLRVIGWGGTCGAIATAQQVGSGAGSIADPRLAGLRCNNVFRVVAFDQAAPAVTAGGGPSAGGLALADPRTPRELEGGSGWRGGGAYGIVPWDAAAGAVTASADAASGQNSVADPRPLPDPDALDAWVIYSPHGGAVHRPFTTLELAALQGLITADDIEAMAAGETTGPAALATLEASDTQKRQWIGNAVPRPTAREIGRVILRVLLAAAAGETFALGSTDPWALPRQIAVGLSVEGAS